MSGIDSIVLVHTSSPGNLGASLRVAANFGIVKVKLVAPGPSPENEEVLRWACGAEHRLDITTWSSLEEALEGASTVVGTASGRGRDNLPVLSPSELVRRLRLRAGEPTLVFGNETSGLSRDHLDRCDLVLRIPTDPGFPVLNLAQAIAISVALVADVVDSPPPTTLPEPADHASVEALMGHMEEALLAVGFLDPVNPTRILRKLRRLLGRAGATENEVAILHGICRQTLWAVRRAEADEEPREA